MFAAAQESSLRVTGAWIRWLPVGLPASGYMQMHNDGTGALALVGAASLDYGQLHHSEMRNGTMEMLPVCKVEIPAHGSVAFQPGGYHIMLMRPRHDIKPGDEVPITLKFSDGSQMCVQFSVRKPDASGGVHMHDKVH